MADVLVKYYHKKLLNINGNADLRLSAGLKLRGIYDACAFNGKAIDYRTPKVDNKGTSDVPFRLAKARELFHQCMMQIPTPYRKNLIDIVCENREIVRQSNQKLQRRDSFTIAICSLNFSLDLLVEYFLQKK